MKTLVACLFGGSLGVMIYTISGYQLTDWQWWAAFLPVAIIGLIYADFPRKRDIDD